MPGQPWTAGPFRGWPSSKNEESSFLQQAQTEHGDGEVGAPERSDILALTVCLREGASYPEVRDFLPGFQPGAMVAAAQLLNSARTRAIQSWHNIVQRPTFTSLEKNATTAALILPVAIGRLLKAATVSHEEESLQELVSNLSHRIKTDTAYAHEVEHELTNPSHSEKRRLRLGEELYHPHKDCLWLSPYFLARRITDLSPNRVSNLVAGKSA